MKISEYPSITSFTEDNIMLVDGNGGTKKMLIMDAILAALHLTSVENHRKIYRGKNLGSVLTTEQKLAIQSGTFEDLWLGDYWEINGVKWRIADFDYWYNCGDTPFTSHHVVVIPDTNLYTAKMNTTGTTTGGYLGSLMYTANLETAKTTITAAFGSSLLTHREYLINTVANGYPSSGVWADSDVDLMNEVMIYGSYVNTPSGDGTVIPKRYTNSRLQLALFSVAPKFINSNPDGQRIDYWTRDIVSDQRFSRVTDYGPVLDTDASTESGVRPAFAIG